MRENLSLLWIGAFAGVSMAMSLRLAQNAWQLGSIGAVIQDWITIIQYRISGAADQKYGKIGDPEVHANVNFIKFFLSRWFSHQAVLMTRVGLAFLWFAGAWLFFKKKRNDFFLLVGIYLISLEWSFLFVQHAMVHSFTLRYVAWPLALSIALLSSHVTNKKVRRNTFYQLSLN